MHISSIVDTFYEKPDENCYMISLNTTYHIYKLSEVCGLLTLLSCKMTYLVMQEELQERIMYERRFV